jgi:hypothetical protein
MYKLLKSHSIKNIQIPETKLFTNDALVSMLTDYSFLYLKSVRTWGGQDISTLRKDGKQWIWQIQGKEAVHYTSFEECFHHIDQFYQGKNAIIQRGIPAIFYKGRPFDIRVHLCKEMNGSWLYAGDLARVGGEGSLVSNVEISNGSVKPTDELVAEVLLEQRSYFSTDLLKIPSLEICKMLDQYHFFTEVGIDFTLDHSGNVWLIEVNTDDMKGGPDPYLFSLLPDQSAYERIIHQKSIVLEKWVQHMTKSFETYLNEKNKDQSK